MLANFLLSLSFLAVLTACGAPFQVDRPLTEAEVQSLDQAILQKQSEMATQRLAEGEGDDILKSIFGSSRACRYSVGVPDKATRGTVALTFDDGPNRKTTPRILDILKKHKIQAVFFVLGAKVKGHEDILQRMMDEGHIVANHSWNHPNFWDVRGRDMRVQIDRTQESIAPYLNGTQYFRYPYGNSSCEANDYLADLGFRRVGWHIDTCDWAYSDGTLSDKEMASCGARPDERNDYLKYVLRQTRKTQGGVMLMHDIHEHTLASLDSVIESLLKDNYKFVLIDDLNYFPILNQERK